jgi:hypothetical protein
MELPKRVKDLTDIELPKLTQLNTLVFPPINAFLAMLRPEPIRAKFRNETDDAKLK